jgi:hypothetical protein
VFDAESLRPPLSSLILIVFTGKPDHC